jgi:lysophospholipase L1-like esterase
VTIPAGQEVVSDPVNVSYQFGEKLAVSVYLKGSFGPLTQHEAQVQTNFATSAGAGDATNDSTGAAFTTSNTEWFMLTGVDIHGTYHGTVALFGSSSIDGHASNYGNTNSYPVANVPVSGQDNDRPSDWLARQLLAAGYRMGVLNAGALGDPAGEDGNSTAPAGVDRINHDVLQQAGIKTVIIYFGGIDLRGDCKPASDVEASLTNMVQQAQASGVRVILATLPPSEYCLRSDPELVPSSTNPYAGDLNPGPENPGSTQRRALNDWIRTSGAALSGVVAIADFDQALADPNHPDFMLPNLNSGDNFHPNGVGYGVQSSAIPLQSILGQ